MNASPSHVEAERARIQARLAALQRLRAEMELEDRPAMLHSILQLIKQDTAVLQRLDGDEFQAAAAEGHRGRVPATRAA